MSLKMQVQEWSIKLQDSVRTITEFVLKTESSDQSNIFINIYLYFSNPLIPLDANGRFLDSVTDYKGVYVKDADSDIKKDLKKRGRLVIET